MPSLSGAEFVRGRDVPESHNHIETILMNVPTNYEFVFEVCEVQSRLSPFGAFCNNFG